MASYKMKIQKEKYNLKVVGVTGSVGKTSTKDIMQMCFQKNIRF